MRWWNNFIFLLMGSLLGIVILKLVLPAPNPSPFLLSPVGNSIPAAPTPSIIPDLPKLPVTLSPAPSLRPQLELQLKTYLAGRPGEWALSLGQESTGSGFTASASPRLVLGLNGDELFPAASVMKLLTALATTEQIQASQLSLQTIFDSRSVGSWLEALLNRSDNYAWDVLRGNVGYGKEQNLVRAFNLQQTSLANNELSPNNSNQVLSIIWLNHQKKLEPDLIPLMAQTETEQRTAQAVKELFQEKDRDPPPVFHKAGTWPPTGTYNDAAIIPLEKDIWYLSILSQGRQSQTEAEETIRELTKIVLGMFL